MKSLWNTYLINKGYLKREVNMLTKSNEPAEIEGEERQLKRYRVHCNEMHYFYYNVEAYDEEEAEDIVNSGNVDYEGDNYDNWQIENVEEIL